MSGIPANQILAIIRIRQWHVDRAALKTAKVTHYQRRGWTQRTNCNADARIVRVLDFERAFAQLTEEEQTVLAARYRDGCRQDEAAKATACSPRKVAYLLPIARQHLAEILDKLDLL
jgi:DNA-directed RNA polymerase specialized sigma24 family protein